MEQLSKRQKQTKETVVADIASSIDHISQSIKSIGESHSAILKVNRAVITYLLAMKKKQEDLNLGDPTELFTGKQKQ